MRSSKNSCAGSMAVTCGKNMAGRQINPGLSVSAVERGLMHEIEGNIFEQKCDAICITTNGVTKLDASGNLVAVMGAGIALAAKKSWMTALQ